MSLSPRAIAVQGVGFSPRLLALQGLWPGRRTRLLSGGRGRPDRIERDAEQSQDMLLLALLMSAWSVLPAP